LISTKNRVDLSSISEVRSYITEWPRFFGPPCRSSNYNPPALLISMLITIARRARWMNASKHRAGVDQLARVFWIHLLDVCSMLTLSCKRMYSTSAGSSNWGIAPTGCDVWTTCPWLLPDSGLARSRTTTSRSLGPTHWPLDYQATSSSNNISRQRVIVLSCNS